MEKRSKAKVPGFNPEYALGVHDDDCERLTLGTLLMKQSALEQVTCTSAGSSISLDIT